MIFRYKNSERWAQYQTKSLILGAGIAEPHPILYKNSETRPHSDNFWGNSTKCLRTKGICSFVPDSSICGFWPFLREFGKQIATYPLPFPGWKRGLEIASISTFHILFITAWNDVSCYVYHANLVIFFRIRKKDRVCLLGEGPYSPFRYIFHAIHLLAKK